MHRDLQNIQATAVTDTKRPKNISLSLQKEFGGMISEPAGKDSPFKSFGTELLHFWVGVFVLLTPSEAADELDSSISPTSLPQMDEEVVAVSWWAKMVFFCPFGTRNLYMLYFIRLL